jgi:hypothetical protein
MDRCPTGDTERIEYKDSMNRRNDAKERCRKRVRITVDVAALWPNRRAGHNNIKYRET